MAHDTKKPANLPRQTFAPRPPRLRKTPFVVLSVALIGIVASWVPLVMFAKARTTDGKEPRVQYIQDMGVQPKYREQQENLLFADGRADRLPVPGTVARGQLQEDDRYYRGYHRVGGTIKAPVYEFYESYPENLKVDAAFVKRGQERFNIYCSTCHGYDGKGNGAINQRATELATDTDTGTKWIPAANLTTGKPTERPVGHIFNTINVGIRSMPGYGAQIPVADRWAIVSYVKALQLSENAAAIPEATPAETKPAETPAPDAKPAEPAAETKPADSK